MSRAQPAVSGRRILVPASARRAAVVGTFSCHWAAVAALVRLRVPEFDLPLHLFTSADRKEEEAMRRRLVELRERTVARVRP